MGKNTEKTLQLSTFKNIELHHKIDVELHHSSEHKSLIYTGANVIDGISLKVEGNTLKIENYNRCNWLRNLKEKPLIKLYVDSLEAITFFGAGNITCVDSIPSKTMLIESWDASGNIDYLTRSNELYIKMHTGVANINCKGSSSFVYLYNNTYSSIKAQATTSQEAYVVSQGFGDVRVFASNKISIEQRTENTIFYNASVTDLNILEQSKGKLQAY